jgi:RES domain-containing protein
MMIVYRISSTEHAEKLQASGMAARWNNAGQKVLYASESRALACLENLAHRSKSGLTGRFRTQVIEIPDQLKIEHIDEKNLPRGWTNLLHYPLCREIGASWFISGKSATLKVPSAMIRAESNYVIHTLHRDFSRIRLVDVEEFTFDPRLKL